MMAARDGLFMKLYLACALAFTRSNDSIDFDPVAKIVRCIPFVPQVASQAPRHDRRPQPRRIRQVSFGYVGSAIKPTADAY